MATGTTTSRQQKPLDRLSPELRNDKDYVETFDHRGDHYNAAALVNKHARDIERKLLMDYLDVKPNHTVCDAPAGGGYLADGLRAMLNHPGQIHCVEPSAVFAKPISADYHIHLNSISEIPVPDRTFDRIGSLAGLHHLKDKQVFFDEAFRTLKPGGHLVVGDVCVDTPVAGFLNGPVDRWTESGHQGIFLSPSHMKQLCQQAGLKLLGLEHHQFEWKFDDPQQMITYCQTLFGMTRANRSQMSDALQEHFAIRYGDDQVLLPWSLLYVVAERPADIRSV